VKFDLLYLPLKFRTYACTCSFHLQKQNYRGKIEEYIQKCMMRSNYKDITPDCAPWRFVDEIEQITEILLSHSHQKLALGKGNLKAHPHELATP
jgi:hypothetical protein